MDAIDKLTPNDPRVQHKTYTIPSNPYNTTYHYLLAEPPSSSPTTGTALLVHGFPDLSFGWRYQVPLLLSLGLRVIVPDLPGFGRTDAPSDLSAYSLQRVVKDLVAIVRQVQGKSEGDDVDPIVLAGHDWGGAVVWRFALWHPEALRCVISVCTPFFPASEVYLPREEFIKVLPNFGYQLQWAGTEVDEGVIGREKIRAFLKVLYGGRREDGKQVFNVATGLDLDALEVDKIGESPLVKGEELEFYADEYVKNGMKGPLTWYKTSKINFDEEKVLFDEGRDKVTLPTLMVVATRDSALPPAMSANMHEYCTNLTKTEVNATHWALWEAAGETNQHFKEFLQGVLKDQLLKASI